MMSQVALIVEFDFFSLLFENLKVLKKYLIFLSFSHPLKLNCHDIKK